MHPQYFNRKSRSCRRRLLNLAATWIEFLRKHNEKPGRYSSGIDIKDRLTLFEADIARRGEYDDSEVCSLWLILAIPGKYEPDGIQKVCGQVSGWYRPSFYPIIDLAGDYIPPSSSSDELPDDSYKQWTYETKFIAIVPLRVHYLLVNSTKKDPKAAFVKKRGTGGGWWWYCLVSRV